MEGGGGGGERGALWTCDVKVLMNVGRNHLFNCAPKRNEEGEKDE